jgi:hypothetical protein
LGWPPGILSQLGWEKPKGMHWGTFNWLKMQVSVLTAESLRGLMQRMGIPPPAPTEERSGR